MSDRKKDAAGAVAGAAAGQGVYQAAAYGPKNYLRRKNGHGNQARLPEGMSRSQYRKLMDSHKKKFNVGPYSTNGPSNFTGYYREYPKSLPGSGVYRLIGHTHSGKKGVAVGAAATAAGAASGVAASRRVKKAMSDAQLARKKRRQAAYSTTTATLGLTALGTKGGAALASRIPKYAAHSPRMDRAATSLTTGAAGIGGFGGYNFAAVEREEARRRKKGESTFGKADEMSTPEFGGWYDRSDVSKAGPYDSEEKRHQRLGAAAGAGAVGTGIVGYQGAKKLKQGVSAERKAMRGLEGLASAKVPVKSQTKNKLNALKDAQKLKNRGAAILGLAALGGAGTAGLARHANKRGKTYRAWYDD